MDSYNVNNSIETTNLIEINNWEKIKPFLNFSKNIVYYLVVLKRNKNSLEEYDFNTVIKEYCLNSLDYLENIFEEIKTLSKTFDAVIYINLNPYDIEKIKLKYLETLIEKLKTNENNLNELMSKVFINTIGEKNIWIVSINNKNKELIQRIKDKINECKPNENKILETLETINGYHIITNPFNKQEFMLSHELYYKCKIYQDSLTLLYYGKQ